MYIDESDPKIQNCSFSYNTGDYAGAVFQAASAPKYQECVFYENHATTIASVGGAIWGVGRNEYTLDNTLIVNCLFYNNSADAGGAVAPGVRDDLVFAVIGLVQSARQRLDRLASPDPAQRTGGGRRDLRIRIVQAFDQAIPSLRIAPLTQ